METEITEKDIGDTITAMVGAWDKDLYSLTDEVVF
jgi:hypothetical protein